MKSKIILIENIDEITKAKEKNIDRAMDLPIPKEVKITKDIFFSMDDVSYAYELPEGNMLLCIKDEYFEVQKTKELIQEVKKRFS